MNPTSTVSLTLNSTNIDGNASVTIKGCVEANGAVRVQDISNVIKEGERTSVALFNADCTRGDFSSIDVSLDNPCIKALNPQVLKRQSTLTAVFDVIINTEVEGCALSAAPGRSFDLALALLIVIAQVAVSRATCIF